jgi:hypothetical protein
MDAQRGAVLGLATGFLRGVTHREVIAARKSQNSLSAYGNRPDAQMLVSAFFQARQTRAQGRKTWIDAHFWHYRPLGQWRPH